MPLDINKIDERIKKLQELRKIAADAEMAKLLSEFMTDEDSLMSLPPVQSKAAAAEAALNPKPDEVSQFVKGVLEGTEPIRPSGPLPAWNSRKS